jgi:hypothetical protein
MGLDLTTIAQDFATAIVAADARRPQASGRNGRVYQAGIGPHAEQRAVALIVAELGAINASRYGGIRTRLLYPGSRQTCDLGIGIEPEWVIEVKMARPNGDNGKPDDTSIKDILSPYSSDRSALSDCVKLGGSSFPCRKAILIYGFEDVTGRRPLREIIGAFEILARAKLTERGARLGERVEASFGDLVHPVHKEGVVFVWEIARLNLA